MLAIINKFLTEKDYLQLLHQNDEGHCYMIELFKEKNFESPFFSIQPSVTNFMNFLKHMTYETFEEPLQVLVCVNRREEIIVQEGRSVHAYYVNAVLVLITQLRREQYDLKYAYNDNKNYHYS